MIKFVFQNLKQKSKKLEHSLRFPFDIFEKTTTRMEMAGRSGQFPNPVRYQIAYYGTVERRDRYGIMKKKKKREL
jgi:hypothetical protein